MRELANSKLKFRRDDRLDQDELDTQLQQKVKIGVKQDYWGSLIKLNSTYLESPDMMYVQQGWLTMFGGAATTAFFIAFIACLVMSVRESLAGIPFDLSSMGGLVISSVSTILFGLLVKCECFKLTHMPVRLNRKTRMLHVFRYDGTVLTVPWDQAFFNIGLGRYNGPMQITYIAGHKMKQPNRMNAVDETFALGAYSGHPDDVVSLWEFFRRYMEEGPEAALENIPEVICLPLDRGREPLSAGMAVIRSKVEGPLLFLVYPLLLLQACCRWLANRTCKVPVWPEEIEKVCVIAADDPCVFDVTTNPARARYGY